MLRLIGDAQETPNAKEGVCEPGIYLDPNTGSTITIYAGDGGSAIVYSVPSSYRLVRKFSEDDPSDIETDYRKAA